MNTKAQAHIKSLDFFTNQQLLNTAYKGGMQWTPVMQELCPHANIDRLEVILLNTRCTIGTTNTTLAPYFWKSLELLSNAEYPVVSADAIQVEKRNRTIHYRAKFTFCFSREIPINFLSIEYRSDILCGSKLLDMDISDRNSLEFCLEFNL